MRLNESAIIRPQMQNLLGEFNGITCALNALMTIRFTIADSSLSTSKKIQAVVFHVFNIIICWAAFTYGGACLGSYYPLTTAMGMVALVSYLYYKMENDGRLHTTLAIMPYIITSFSSAITIIQLSKISFVVKIAFYGLSALALSANDLKQRFFN